MANVKGAMPLAYQYSVPVQSDAGRIPDVQDQPPQPDYDNPSLTSSAHEFMKHDWHLCRTLYEGTRMMRRAKTEFLPQYERETDKEYERRLNATTLLNMFRLAVMNAVGRPFSKPIVIANTSSQVVFDWVKDFDMEGHDINVWARRAMREGLIDGMVHCLIDHVALPDGLNAKEFMELGGGRPYACLVPAQMLLAAYTDFVGGLKRCVHARIREWHTYLNGFREEKRERVRVLEPGYYQLWEAGPGGWGIIEEGQLLKADGTPWQWVPLETWYAGTSDIDYVVTPPFLDLAYKNVEHWQSTSDQRNILTKGRFPMLAASGVDPNSVKDESGNLVVGPHTALVSEDPAGKWYYVEPGGAAIAAGEKDLEHLEQAMSRLAMDPVQTQHGRAQTATGQTLEDAKARAPLEIWARDFSNFLERVVNNFFMWLAIPDGKVDMEVNTDFGLDLANIQELTTLTTLRGMRELTRSTLYSELKRRQVLGDAFDPDLEEALLEIEASQMPGFGAPDGNLPPEGTDPSLGLGAQGPDPSAVDPMASGANPSAPAATKSKAKKK
ncbi:DUF4055 domain-containing protein [Hyphomicrobium sp.]|uniref:DUF4055 domain-containing protein n=1 Tax=Hyphomicrobium sp. TaxID=82 RepID=UPI001D1ECC0E|nr:DUF4055 domain-containing protein [Hyphomicrobium sp.]MBY0559832.1 DUF4055 domain-containing protein [Hyphomicrobium sp.]